MKLTKENYLFELNELKGKIEDILGEERLKKYVFRVEE